MARQVGLAGVIAALSVTSDLTRGDLIDPTRPAEAIRFLSGLGHGAEKLRVLARAPKVAKIVQEAGG